MVSNVTRSVPDSQLSGDQSSIKFYCNLTIDQLE